MSVLVQFPDKIAEAAKQREIDAICNDRNRFIAAVRAHLKRRSGKDWSVKGGRGTGWGWVKIDAPPRRCRFDFDGNPLTDAHRYGYMSPEDRAELGRLLGYDKPVHHQGESIPPNGHYREEYLARAAGETPRVIGTPYWD